MAKQLKEFLESFEFNRAALAKQRLANLRHSGRRVRGARIANLMRAAGLKEEEMDEEDLDQLDEVLNKDASASDWIHDFVHSTNPKFEGKSKKERIKMALGAYYGKQRNEEVDLTENDHDPYFRAQENKRSADAAHQQGDHVAYHLHMADHHDDLAHWHQLRGRNHVSNQHLNKAEYHAHLASELRKKEIGLKEEVEKKDKKEDLPFIPDKPKKNPPATAGKYGQGYSTARHLARQGMKQAMKEEFDMDVSDDELDQIVEDVLDALVNKQLEEGAFSSGALKAPKSWLDAAKKIPSTGTIRDKDAKGVYTAKTVNGKEVSRVYDKQNEEFDLEEGIAKVYHNVMSKRADRKADHAFDMGDEKEFSKQVDKSEYHRVKAGGKPTKINKNPDSKWLTTREEVEHTGPVKVKVQADKEAHEEKWESAKKKPVKEQYDEEGNLIPMAKTYQEFMEAMTATVVRPGVTRYTGGSYGSAKGAKYGNTDYDKETLDTKDDEGEETPKRGRGRPAGSKSGARGPRIK